MRLSSLRWALFAAGEPVTPVCLRYNWRHYNPSGCGKNHVLPVALLRTLLQFKNSVEITILDTYVPSGAEISDPRLYASNVRRVMASHLQVAVTEHSYDDAFLAYESKAHVGSDFEVARLKSLYNCSYEELKELLKAFELHDKDHSGAISCDEFREAVGTAGLCCSQSTTGEASLEQIFAFFDQDNSGEIEYREFIQVAALLSGRCTSQSRAKLAFLIYDTEKQGKVRRGILQQAVNSSVASLGDDLGHELLEGEDDELDFAQFCTLVAERPEALEAALEPLRLRLNLPTLGSAAPSEIKKDK
eukprot:gb/GFBE01065404.1/.p1 GENE.gb/GFBE01065404.1/~~gb/GFBE01065404.1/.p1  ORF type:complete len:303 (+),score=74.21 gb/GFBE01065404.1/:1-909(+)